MSQTENPNVPRIDKNLEQLELSYIAGGNVEYTDILKSSTAVSYK